MLNMTKSVQPHFLSLYLNMFKNHLDLRLVLLLYFERVQSGGYMLTNSYLVYLLISIAVTLGVGNTLIRTAGRFSSTPFLGIPRLPIPLTVFWWWAFISST